jgi:hypothetical protein
MFALEAGVSLALLISTLSLCPVPSSCTNYI